MWRLIYLLPLLIRIIRIPRVSRTLNLVWRLTFDRRVPLLLRMLVPAAIVYLFVPFGLIPDYVPYAGLLDDLLFLALAVFLLLNFAPRYVKESYTGEVRREERDPKRVVEGRYHVVDEERPPQ